MSTLEIVTYPDKFLRHPTEPLENIDGAIQKIIDSMARTMYAAPGIGLAAIQVRFNKSILIYDISTPEEKRNLQVLINPEIIEGEGETLSENEGCLSIPDLRANVKRFSSVLVVGVNRDGNPERFEIDGFLSLVLQHEIDHLNGRLLIDRISPLKRELYKRQIKKNMRKK
jgi:peptide deformylase